MSYNIKQQIRTDTPQVGYAPYRQVHAHSTGNSGSTAQNEADYMSRKDLNTGFYTHVVGNGQVIQVAPVNRGAWDVGGGYNYETYAAVELIESHGSKEEFMRDYKIYCELLYDLAKQGGIPTTLDTGDLAGIKTHNYCTHNQPNNGSDHVDPIPYLTKWGITQQQFANDIANCKGNNNSGNNGGNTPQPQKGDDLMKFIQIIDGKYKNNQVLITPDSARWVKSAQESQGLQKLYGVIKMDLASFEGAYMGQYYTLKDKSGFPKDLATLFKK